MQAGNREGGDAHAIKSLVNQQKKCKFFCKKCLIFMETHAILNRSEIKVSPLRGREPYRRSNRRMNA